jgi:tripartite-type tricarboxylate transporter receptor subunit TctC
MSDRHLLRSLAPLAAAFALAAATPAAQAQQAWPSARPVRLVVSYPPGGGADVMARLVAPKLSEALGQQVVVENKPGASGQIAADLVARSAPDGYTLLLDASSFATNPALFPKLPYNPATAFAPVTVLALFPNMLVVYPKFAANSARELIDMARAKPGSIAYASSGNGSAQHLAAELFAQRMKLDMVHVPYKGGGPAMTDVMGGQVPVFFANVASGFANVKSGRLRALALTGGRRVAVLPDVPTLKEVGVPDYEVYEWNPVFAPAGTPAEIVNQLSAAIRKVMAQPDVRERVAGMGGETLASTPQEAGAFVRTQTEFWARVIRQADIKPD